jgi:apolipoprotein N-acyltransferase
LRLRAIESRTDFVRAANTGISGFVDRRGSFFEATDLYVETVAVRDMHLTTKQTLYNQVGDVVAWLALAGLALTILIARGKQRI